MAQLDNLIQEPITISPNFSIQQVIIKLLENNISRLIVNGSNPFLGIVTAKDIGIFLLNDDSEKSLDSIQVSEFVKPLISVDKNTKIPKCAEIMVEKEIGSLGVTSFGKLVGIISKTDLVKYYEENYQGLHKVGDLMTVSYVFMNSNDSLQHIISKMTEEKISRVFLENSKNELEGILTFKDLFPLAIKNGHLNTLHYNDYPETSVLHMGKGFGHTTFAKDIMNKNIITINYDNDVSTACNKMIQNQISGVGVNIMDKTSGIISKTDVVKAISKIKE